MKLLTKLFCLVPLCYLSGCAYVQAPPENVEQDTSILEQKLNQEKINEVITPTLKRKIAIARMTNSSSFGRSLLSREKNNGIDDQLTDLLANALTQSKHFIVLERPDLGSLIIENAFTGSTINKVGADLLIVGSLSEFGRKTDGRSGFLTTTKRQVANAKVDIRLIDVETARVVFATTGQGEALTETGSIFGLGSNVSLYDGTLNDKAISIAISEAVSNLISDLDDKPWRSYLIAEDPALVMSGGKQQGIKIKDVFAVKTKGKQVKSQQTGFLITLPGKEIARIKVVSQFGDDETNEGSVCELVEGSLGNYSIDDVVIEEI